MAEDKEKILLQIALFKYSVIAPLVTNSLGEGISKEAFFRSASQRIYNLDGEPATFSASTIKRWYLKFNHDGLDGLKPKTRSDLNTSRVLDNDIVEYINVEVTNHPRKPATVIYDELIKKGIINKGDISLSTVTRETGRQRKSDNSNSDEKVRMRYEREFINQVWCGDSSVGPRVYINGKSFKTYVIAYIDDCSRMIVGIDIFLNDNTANVLSVMKTAVESYGVPSLFNFDNGSSYKNANVQRTIAAIKSEVHYDHAYSPQEKAKIERFFKTLKTQWMSSYNNSKLDLNQIREELKEFAQTYNKTPHSALKDMSPIQKFFSQQERIKYLDAMTLHEAFMIEIERKATIDRIVTINNLEYEIPPQFANKNVRLITTPDYTEIYVIEHLSGQKWPVKVVDKIKNSMTKRKNFYYTENLFGNHEEIEL